LANSPQARKRARQAENRRQHNAAMRSMVRTYLKKVEHQDQGNGSLSLSLLVYIKKPALSRFFYA